MVSIKKQIVTGLNNNLEKAMRDFETKNLIDQTVITIAQNYNETTVTFPYINVVEIKNVGISNDLSNKEIFSNIAYAIEIYDKKEHADDLFDFIIELVDGYLTTTLGMRRINLSPIIKEKIFQDGVHGVTLQYEAFINNTTKKIYQYI